MFKKDNDLSKSFSKEKDFSQCTLCHHLSSKAIVYVCESGHILCGRCRTNSTHDAKLDDGDCLKYKKKSNKIHKETSRSKFTKTDLACGDFASNAPKVVCKDIDSYKQEKEKVIVTFKNEFYKESDTSAVSYGNSPERAKLVECSPVSRPLACPVCTKIVAVDSILQHFSFDHSKVSRYLLKLQINQPIVMKVVELEEGTNCLAVILLHNEKSSSKTPMLLMAARIRSSSRSEKSQKIKDSSAHSNIGITRSNSIYSEDTKNSKDDNKEMEEIYRYLVMWLCKTVETEVTYSLTISKEDNKMSFSYTGDAVHIKNHQSGVDMFRKCECVIVKSTAVKKLVNNIGCLHLFVTIIHVE